MRAPPTLPPRVSATRPTRWSIGSAARASGVALEQRREAAGQRGAISLGSAVRRGSLTPAKGVGSRGLLQVRGQHALQEAAEREGGGEHRLGGRQRQQTVAVHRLQQHREPRRGGGHHPGKEEDRRVVGDHHAARAASAATIPLPAPGSGSTYGK